MIGRSSWFMWASSWFMCEPSLSPTDGPTQVREQCPVASLLHALAAALPLPTHEQVRVRVRVRVRVSR